MSCIQTEEYSIYKNDDFPLEIKISLLKTDDLCVNNRCQQPHAGAMFCCFYTVLFTLFLYCLNLYSAVVLPNMMNFQAVRDYYPEALGLPGRGVEMVILYLKRGIVYLKRGVCALKTRNYASKLMNLLFKMMNFVSKMMILQGITASQGTSASRLSGL